MAVTYTDLLLLLVQTCCISMRTGMNAQNPTTLCYICPQSNQNSPNHAKQTCIRQQSIVAIVTTLPRIKSSCLHCCFRWSAPEMTVKFSHISRRPSIELELDSMFGMSMNRTEILSTFHTLAEYISVQKICHSNQWGENPLKQPLPLGHLDLHLMHECLRRPHSLPPNNSLLGPHTFAQLCNKVPIGYYWTP